MTVLIYIALLLLNCIIVAFHRKSDFIAIISAGLMLLIYAGNVRERGDIAFYRQYYGSENIKYVISEWGYNILTDFFYKIGVNFHVFLGIIFLLFVLLCAYVYREMKINVNVIVVCYGAFLFFSLWSL